MSFSKQYHLLHILTFRYKPKEPNEGVDGGLNSFRRNFAQVTVTLSPRYLLTKPIRYRGIGQPINVLHKLSRRGLYDFSLYRSGCIYDICGDPA